MLDVMTIAIILIVVAVNVVFLLWLAALPGHIARERNHLQAEAIGVCGWLSLLTLFATWPIALVWAYTKSAHVTIDDPKSASPAGR